MVRVRAQVTSITRASLRHAATTTTSGLPARTADYAEDLWRPGITLPLWKQSEPDDKVFLYLSWQHFKNDDITERVTTSSTGLEHRRQVFSDVKDVYSGGATSLNGYVFYPFSMRTASKIAPLYHRHYNPYSRTRFHRQHSGHLLQQQKRRRGKRRSSNGIITTSGNEINKARSAPIEALAFPEGQRTRTMIKVDLDLNSGSLLGSFVVCRSCSRVMFLEGVLDGNCESGFDERRVLTRSGDGRAQLLRVAREPLAKVPQNCLNSHVQILNMTKKGNVLSWLVREDFRAIDVEYIQIGIAMDSEWGELINLVGAADSGGPAATMLDFARRRAGGHKKDDQQRRCEVLIQIGIKVQMGRRMVRISYVALFCRNHIRFYGSLSAEWSVKNEDSNLSFVLSLPLWLRQVIERKSNEHEPQAPRRATLRDQILKPDFRRVERPQTRQDLLRMERNVGWDQYEPQDPRRASLRDQILKPDFRRVERPQTRQDVLRKRSVGRDQYEPQDPRRATSNAPLNVARRIKSADFNSGKIETARGTIFKSKHPKKLTAILANSM
ncbi:hypothetical protein BDZ89DRAFT_1116899 [Hymenopellis radicata]|nr:hypothetical protein BDZ89DRAFT_1116899 [Hymenopellis radicata]